uniref:Uncharacterized protein n=1 Tax=Picea sitchensis TaxID=3332 RepID=A9NM97_PICSI|nr:unknown [Picea sitchensis]
MDPSLGPECIKLEDHLESLEGIRVTMMMKKMDQISKRIYS